MRLNEPVTQQEYLLAADQTMVSTTDTKGRILYVNPSFIEASGYTREELLGQPHNMIRHPDMPAEAFRDLWETVQDGMPWSALVKNRRKNGDHYWVQANVTPLMRDGKPVAYMSVRTCPSREAVREAEGLYRMMRDEASNGTLIHRLHQGHLEDVRWPARLRRTLTPGTQTRLALVAGACASFGVLATALLSPSTDSPWTWTLLTLSIGAVAAALGGGLLGRLLLTPIQRLLMQANRMAAGDLTQKITVEGRGLISQFTQALAQLNVNLLSIVSDARNESNQMRVATREIASGNHDLSQRTESQAANLEQTASAIEQITGTARQSSGLAAEAAGIANEATHATQRSQSVVDTVGAKMDDIKDYSNRIRDIIGVIDSIAFQTNILALNAAVEAARAGDQGRGFAVVASEVRALSQRTSTAAKEIAQLIQSSGARVDEGAQLATDARQAMHEAVSSVQRLDGFLAQISNATAEQLTGISNISEAVNRIDTFTQQNAALVEEIAAAAQSLHHQAEVVSDAVGIFNLDNGVPPPVAGTDAVALRKAMKAAA